MSLGIFLGSPAKYGCKNSSPLDSGREVLAAAAGKGRGKGVGWEPLQGAASIADTMLCHTMLYHAIPCHAVLCRAMPCCASSRQSRSWQQELGKGKAVSCMQVLCVLGCRCEVGEASREEI